MPNSEPITIAVVHATRALADALPWLEGADHHVHLLSEDTSPERLAALAPDVVLLGGVAHAAERVARIRAALSDRPCAILLVLEAGAPRPSPTPHGTDGVIEAPLSGRELALHVEYRRALVAQAHALRTTQTLLQVASRIARVGAWRVSLPDARIVWTEGTYTIHEVPPGFTPSIESADGFYTAAYAERIRGAFERCFRAGTPFDEEARLVTAKGRELWVRAMGEAERNAAGEVVAVHGAILDIDERKTTELRLLTTLESMTDAVYTLDHAWRFTFLNREAERLLGRAREELVGRNVWAEFPPAAESVIAEEYAIAASTKTVRVFETFYAPLDKRFEIRAFPSADGLVVYFRDVTERHRQEAQLREQATLLDHAQDAILVRDLDGRIVYWNRGAERLYGYTAAEALGRFAYELLYHDREGYDAATSAVLSRGAFSGELAQRTRDGETRMVEARWTLVRDEAGVPRSILAINTDITLRKQLESQMLRAQRLQGLGTLAGGIAHDLNNLIAPVLLSIDGLRETEADPGRLEDLATMETCARRGAELVRQLLAFARGGGDEERMPVDLGAIALEVQALVRDSLPSGVVMRIDVAEDLWKVRANPTQMVQVLTNLCVNARDAMPDGGVLRVSVSGRVVDEGFARARLDVAAGPYVCVRVEDEGVGMSRAILERIFEPFFTTKEVGRGTGLGLSTTHAIVRTHGGFIDVASEPGRGTTFEVWLPALAQDPSADTVRPAPPSLPRGRGELVLVVDDEAGVRETARRTLERFGYRAILAANGAEAVSLYAQRRAEIDVVLTDMTMPVMDGRATIIALRAIDPSVRIIAMSGLGAGDHGSAAPVAAQRFVAKPYTASALLEALRDVIGA